MRFAPNNRLTVTVMLTATVAAAALAGAAELVKPNMKPGLWEVSLNPQVSGQLPISDEQLARMTPEQRARMEAVMKAYAGQGAQPRIYRECMTPERIARGLDIDRKGEDASCTRKVVSSSPNELTLHDECNKPQQKTVSDVHFEIKGGKQMSGKVNVVTTSAGKTMTVNSVVQGKWLSSDCGSVKDTEVEK